MRIPPQHVVKALKNYDRDLGLEWCQEKHCWYFTWRGTRWWVWLHKDGSLAQSDVSVAEALSIVKQADNVHTGGIRLKAMEARQRERRARFERERQLEMEEARRAGEDRTRTWLRGGPKPFVHLEKKTEEARGNLLRNGAPLQPFPNLSV